jgi:hypothetical protein
MPHYQTPLCVYVAAAAAAAAALQDPVDKEERQMGKRVNFSIVYGAGSSKIGKDAGLTSKEAQAFLKRCDTFGAGSMLLAVSMQGTGTGICQWGPSTVQQVTAALRSVLCKPRVLNHQDSHRLCAAGAVQSMSSSAGSCSARAHQPRMHLAVHTLAGSTVPTHPCLST